MIHSKGNAMKKILLASAGAVSILALAAPVTAVAQDMAHAYEITVMNTMPTEFIAPVLVAGTDHDGDIFAGHYVTSEAETQVLTGDPKQLAARIGAGATVAHGSDGPPAVLLAPGKSITFTLETSAKEIRVFAMVAPTEKPDNYLTATVKLGAPMMDDKMAAKPMEGMADDKAMPADAMAKDTMAKDAMEKDTMTTAAMPADTMAKDSMAKDAMVAEPMMIPSGRQLRMGSRGERVTMLRKRLGVDAMGANANVFDADLKSAVMDYQHKAGLTADGVVGRMTLESLNHPPMDDKMAKDTMMDDKAMPADAMAKDTMAKDAMAKDTMAKDSMAKDDSMAMKDGMMSSALHRFDIGHDENTKTITEITGTFGTVTVKAL
jgi:pentapeptide MXKDX repeat protein